MAGYILRRLAQTIPVLFGVTVVIFLLLNLVPGDPARLAGGAKAPGKAALRNIRERHYLDRPLPQQYWRYMSGLARGDLGTSYRFKRPVADMIAGTLPNSAKLAAVAVALELLIGLGAGILAAVKRASFIDHLATAAVTVLFCLPVFWLGMLLQVWFGLKLGWLPLSGMGDGSPRFYVLPALTLAAASAAYLARVSRNALLEELSRDYILTARANGLHPASIVLRHALRNSILPVLTLAALDFGTLIGAAVGTEVVFSWPGLGSQLYTAILARDRPLVLGITLVLVIIFVAVNLAVDLVGAWLSPGRRHELRGTA